MAVSGAARGSPTVKCASVTTRALPVKPSEIKREMTPLFLENFSKPSSHGNKLKSKIAKLK